MKRRLLDHSLLAVTGYTDRLSAQPGERVNVHASSTYKTGSLRVVRLDHDGKSYCTEPLGRAETIHLEHREVNVGSCGIVDAVSVPPPPVLLRCWLWLTLLPDTTSAKAALLSICGLELTVDRSGNVVFSAGDCRVTSAVGLQLRRWYEVIGGIDADRRIFVIVRPQKPLYGEPASSQVVSEETAELTPRSDALVIGRGINGKLEDVSIGRRIEDAADDAVLRLDFAHGIAGWLLHDVRGAAVGRVEGLPTRATKGRHWDGTQHDWRYAPEHYRAIHFHSDDQGDQGWPITATLDLPKSLPAGMYAVELSAGQEIDHLPLVVRRGRGEAAPFLVVLPSLTYLAYALEHLEDEQVKPLGWVQKCPELAAPFARANGYHSLYDTHADASRVSLCSIHRPLLGMRPDHRFRYFGCEHGLSADLQLLGWLRRQGFAFDLATDHDLHAAGAELLRPYKGVLTGSHPEYMTDRILDAFEGYLAGGGNLAYLGGNGFFVKVTLDPNDSSIAELRRGGLLRSWEGDAGDDHYQLTGAPAGGAAWSSIGRPTAALVGVTWGSTSLADGAPYRRTPASFDPRVAHLFIGIGDDELIGEHGAILGAAASFEVDIAHPLLGTPAHALVIATAKMSDMYHPAPRTLLEAVGGETSASLHRADMVYFETLAGGAVFSASSIGWSGALSHDADQNAASRLTANLLRSFIDPPQKSR